MEDCNYCINKNSIKCITCTLSIFGYSDYEFDYRLLRISDSAGDTINHEISDNP